MYNIVCRGRLHFTLLLDFGHAGRGVFFFLPFFFPFSYFFFLLSFNLLAIISSHLRMEHMYYYCTGCIEQHLYQTNNSF